MKKYLFILASLAFFVVKSEGQTELVLNGNFSTTGYAWGTTGNWYYNSTYSSCYSCPGYAYASGASGTPTAYLSGEITQNITIPASASSATLSFYTSATLSGSYTGSEEIIPYLYDYTTSLMHTIDYIHFTSSSGYTYYSYSISSSLFGHTLLLGFSASSGATPTTIRLDNVSLMYTGCSVPASPSSLTATALSSSTVQLSWPSASGATYYNVYYSSATCLGDFTVHASPTTSPYTVTGLSPSTTYYFNITANNSCGVCAFYSPCANATTLSGGSAPLTPTGLSVSPATCSTMNISWSPSAGATNYTIESCSGAFVASTTGTSYSASGLSSTTYYDYKVNASNSFGSSSYSSCMGATTPSCGAPPVTPTGLSVSSSSCSTMVISWSPSAGATDYTIETCIGSFVATTSGTSYTVSGLSGSTPYSYMVRANNGYGSSSYSSCLGATTPACGTAPLAPTGLVATPMSCTSIELDWFTSTGATNYVIYDCSTGLSVGSTPATSYTVTGLSPSTAYNFKVEATNSYGNSPFTACKSATTPSCGSSLPDLTIVSPSANITNLVPYASTQITYTVKNIGSGNASSSTTSFFLSHGPAYSPGDTWLKDDPILSIPSTGSSLRNVTISIPGGVASGVYYITAIVDAPNTIAESNENNNESYVGVNIGESLNCSSNDYPYTFPAGGACDTHYGEDPWGFYKFQCTSYVAWKENEFCGNKSTTALTYKFFNAMNHGHASIDPDYSLCSSTDPIYLLSDACHWGVALHAMGFTVDNNPTVGAIAHWKSGENGASGAGHVGFVESVSGSVVCISNYNGFDSDGSVIKHCNYGHFYVDMSLPYSNTPGSMNRIPSQFIHLWDGGYGSASGIRAITSNNDVFDVYPNPTTGKVNISLSNSENINHGNMTIINSLGQQIIFKKIDNSLPKYEFDLSKWPDGLYYILIKTDRVNIVRKLELIH